MLINCSVVSPGMLSNKLVPIIAATPEFDACPTMREEPATGVAPLSESPITIGKLIVSLGLMPKETRYSPSESVARLKPLPPFKATPPCGMANPPAVVATPPGGHDVTNPPTIVPKDGCVAPAPEVPVLPVDPVGPEEPVGPVGPVTPVGPVAPVLDPVLPVAPVDAVNPVDPVAPVGPVNPVAPVVDPVNPEEPVNPVNPGNPVEPVVPVLPV